MTFVADPRRQAFLPYLLDLAARMKVGHWNLSISDDPPPETTSEASMFMRSWQHTATLHISDKFLSETPESQRVSVVHEVLHCVLWHVHRAAEDEMKGSARRTFERELEFAIEDLARVIAPSMPLPEIAHTGEPS